MKKNLAIFSILFPIILIGCGDEGSGGGTTVDPNRSEPVIIDSALSIAVSDDRPDGITDTFFDSSERIYLWIYWANVSGEHRVTVRWFSPDESADDPPFREDTHDFTSANGDQITWFYVNRPTIGFTEGEWFVEVYLDDLFERSYIFTVK